MTNVDFGKTAEDYARYRVGFPDALFDRLADRGVGTKGQRVLDLGTGTGTLARAFARRGCDAVGLDTSEEIIAEAKRLDLESDVRTTYVVGPAERTGLDAHSFDV